MIQKILSFITDREKFLALRNNSEDPKKHGGDYWFIVSGAIENKESKENAIKREVKEETNLEIEKIVDLKLNYKYENWQGLCNEDVFLSFVKKGQKVKLDMIEHIEYKWLDLDEFIDLIFWDDNKEKLKEILKNKVK